MNKYKRGARLEYKVKDALEQVGYVVIRSAGSHGPWDLTAVSETEVRLIQLKMQKEDKVSEARYMDDFKKILDVSVPANVYREFHVHCDRKGLIARYRWDCNGVLEKDLP